MSPNPIWGNDWEEVRGLWPLDPAAVHCNHGSFGAVPEPVYAVQETMRRRMVTNPVQWFHGDMTDAVRDARAEVARFFHAEPDDVAFVSNVTSGTSTVLQCLDLGPDDEIVVSDHIYGAVSLAVERLCGRTGARRVDVTIPYDTSDDDVVMAFGSRCSDRTALVIVDQVTSATARRFPVKRVTAAAHAVGAAVFVDGAHAAGMLPVDIPAIGADFWVGNLHKWPCAPAGTAVLWITPAWQERIVPLVVSHADLEGFPAAFDRLGTNDLSAWIASPHALCLLGQLGWDRVRAHNEALVVWAQHAVADILGVSDNELRHDPGTSMAIVPLPHGLADTPKEARALQDHLGARQIMVAMPCFGDRGTIRLSAHVYNQPSDYERVGRGIREFMTTRP
jgi:isopenicillin-N epimerase